MRPDRRALAALALTASCSNAQPVVIVLPELGERITLVGVLVFQGDRLLESSGLLAPGASREIVFEAVPGDTDIVVIGYDDEYLHPSLRPPAEVLAAAPLVLATAEGPFLPPPAIARKGTLTGNELSGLAETSLPELAASWVAPCARTACEVLNLGPGRNVPLPEESAEVGLCIPWSNAAEEALLVMKNRRLLRFDPRTDRATFLTETSTTPISAGEIAEDGTLLLLDREGRLARWRHDGAPELVGALPGSAVEELAISRGSTPPEILVAGAAGVLAAREDDRWRVLYQSTDTTIDTAGLAWLGPGEVLASFRTGDEIIHWKDGGIAARFRIPGAKPLAYADGLGVLLGLRPAEAADSPQLLRYEGGAWAPFLDVGPIIGRAPEGIWPVAPGTFVFGGVNGQIAVYDAEIGGACLLPLLSSVGVKSVRRLEQGLLLRIDRPAFVGFIPFAGPQRRACQHAYRAPG
ncbi:MAG: hypothetical protein IT384_08940 [Deltaproteobacteria bacterium]|nr:hypothetical protein [Deltaproteobacteria bacterium]